MADHLIPFTEQELADLMEAIDFARVQIRPRDSEWQRWALLFDRLKSYESVPVCEIEPHLYVPSATHMGDCAICGHLQGAPHHSPFRRSR